MGGAPSDIELRRRELESARASARALQAADDARRDIGRHLHDQVQTLAIAARQQLHLAQSELELDPVRARELLARTSEHLEELSRELRDLARGLHPVGLEAGLRPALRALAQRSPLELVVEAMPDAPLGPSIEATVYAMVSEALNNATKHAGATRVVVRARADESRLTVEVVDDGEGGADVHSGSGLLGIRDRITLLNGTLSVDSPPGGGTLLRATIPLFPERLAHRQHFRLGPMSDAELEAKVADLRSGRKRAGLSVAREAEIEGVPRLGQLVPVVDERGRQWVTVEITGLRLVRMADLDLETLHDVGVAGETLEACRAAVFAFYDHLRPMLSLLLDEPEWRLTDDERMVVMTHRVVTDADDDPAR